MSATALRTALSLALLLPASLLAQGDDWKAVDAAMGRTATVLPGGVHKFGMPRADLRVRIGAVTLRPTFALGSWIAFQREGTQAMAMGDLVLLPSEVEPVRRSLQSSAIVPSALHNHLLNESPHVMYMHVEAHGDAVQIARAIRAALALTGTPATSGAATPVDSRLDTALIVNRLGYRGKVVGGVLQIAIARQDSIRSGGMLIPPSMGVATAINVQSAGRNLVAVTGDFVLAADEVQPVINALTANAIAVTALHSHLLAEEPRLLFLHFYGVGAPDKLADGLRLALARTRVVAPVTPSP
ncbi:MAG: DUF1259 domain-containing protein [Gemmatimonadota bacterium]